MCHEILQSQEDTEIKKKKKGLFSSRQLHPCRKIKSHLKNSQNGIIETLIDT